MTDDRSAFTEARAVGKAKQQERRLAHADPRCKHCRKPIEQVNWANGPGWKHRGGGSLCEHLRADLLVGLPEPTFTASEVKELTTKATEVALALGRKEALAEVQGELDALRALWWFLQNDFGVCDNGHSASITWNEATWLNEFHDAVEVIYEERGYPPEPPSLAPGAAPEPLTAPAGHSDLPPTHERLYGLDEVQRILETPDDAPTESATSLERPPKPCPECGRLHVMGCPECGADLDIYEHYRECSQYPTPDLPEGHDQ